MEREWSMSYIVNNGIYEPDGNYVFISKRTGIISKILILTKGDTIGNYDMLREYIAPEGKEF